MLLKNTPASNSIVRIILAHGAGAPMDSEFMETTAKLLSSKKGFETIRFEFPYMHKRRESGIKRPPDHELVLLETWRQVLTSVRAERHEGRFLFIGGKSLGARMASMIADEAKVDGLLCFGYPFHPANKPGSLRTSHLQNLQTPTLIIQGSRDPLGNLGEVKNYSLSSNIHVEWLEDGDHDFKPRVKSGYTQLQHMATATDLVADFIQRVCE
jgi:uncharacterized protein